jgi:hypothetical protein
VRETLLGIFSIEEVVPHIGELYALFTHANGSLVKVPMRYRAYQLFLRDGFMCRVCGTVARFAALYRYPDKTRRFRFVPELGADELMLTQDHIVPKSLGGPNDMSNLQTLCWRCNQEKGNSYKAA